MSCTNPQQNGLQFQAGQRIPWQNARDETFPVGYDTTHYASGSVALQAGNGKREGFPHPVP
jgi:hypothetical protein